MLTLQLYRFLQAVQLNFIQLSISCKPMLTQQAFPHFKLTEQLLFKEELIILTKQEAQQLLPSHLLQQFREKGKAKGKNQTYLTIKQCKKHIIECDSQITFSKAVQQTLDFHGIGSTLLSSAYSFNVKSTQTNPITLVLNPNTRDIQGIIGLAHAFVRSKMLANGRGDIYGSPDYFVQQAKQFAMKYSLKIKILRGSDLKQQGLNLFHAVGRASIKDSALINLSYKGNPNSQGWLALIGKGVCFDTGGLDLKAAASLKPMFLDKSGACSCLAAFEQIVKEKLALNVTITLGMVQNFIGKRSYRPSDIIISKKGFAVEIADTDAEGRLVLADCMTWTQQNYKVEKLVELSTLTYSCIVALGHERAGIFGNCQKFNELLKATGQEVLELGWILPLDEIHYELLFSSVADFLSDANDTVPGASIAAAFLQKFVEAGVQWIHLDVGGTCIDLAQNRGTGYGARLLLQLARKLARAKQIKD